MPRSSSHRQRPHTHAITTKTAVLRRPCQSFARATRNDQRILALPERQALAHVKNSTDTRMLFKATAPSEFRLRSARRNSKDTSHLDCHDSECCSTVPSHVHWLSDNDRFAKTLGSPQDFGEKLDRYPQPPQHRGKDAKNRRHHLEGKTRLTRDRRHHTHDMHLDLHLVVSEHEQMEEDTQAAVTTVAGEDHRDPSSFESDDDVEIIDGFSPLRSCVNQSQTDRAIAALTFAIANGACGLDDSQAPRDFGGLLDIPPLLAHQTDTINCGGDLWH